ncbi:hypothetical protein FHS10_001970 [Mucilaginibacter dorajii]|nr:hypothetical protein [Mucilaginibacter dorajii]
MKKKFVNIPFKVKIIIRETYLSRFNYRCVHLQTASYINTKAHISNTFIEDVKKMWL